MSATDDGRGGRGLRLVLLFAALVRVGYFAWERVAAPFDMPLILDAARYDLWARAIAAGQAFEPGRPFYQAPLYPLLVSAVYRLFGPTPTVVFAAQALAGLMTIAVIFEVGRRAYGRAAGTSAAALAALYGVFLFYETKLVPATLTTLLAALAVERLQAARQGTSWRGWASAGVVLGLAALTSPGLLLLAALATLGTLLAPAPGGGARLRRAGVMGMAVAVVIAPVTAYNVIAGGDRVLIAANGGVTFAQGNSHEAFLAGGGHSRLPGLTGTIDAQRDESVFLAERAQGRVLRDSEVSAYWFGQGVAYIRDHPREYLHLQARRFLLVVDSYEHAMEYDPQLDPNPFRLIAPVPFALILGLAVVGVGVGVAARRARASDDAPVVWLLLAQTSLLFAFFVCSRYRQPLMPALLVLAGVGGLRLAESRGRRSGVLCVVLLAVSGVSLGLLPAYRPRLYAQERAQSIKNVGLALGHTVR